MSSLRVWAPGPDQKEQKSGWWRGGQAGLHPVARGGTGYTSWVLGASKRKTVWMEVTLSETITRFEENVRFRKSHSGPRSLPNWDLREPSEKRLPPREKLPQLGEVIRRRGALGPPWCRPGPGLSGPSWGPVGGCGTARRAEAAAAVAGRARRPGPGAGRALYQGRRLRQEAGGGEGEPRSSQGREGAAPRAGTAHSRLRP